MDMEPASTGGIAGLLAKLFTAAAKLAATPGAVGVIGAAVLFIFLWPKTAKEGICRLAVGGLSSHVFGPSVLKTILHHAEWLHAEDIQTGAYLLAAWPAWWLLGLLVRRLSGAKTLGDLVKDVKEIS